MRHIIFVLLALIAPQVSQGQGFPLPCPTVQEDGGSPILSDYDPPFRLKKADMGSIAIYHPFLQRKIAWGVCGNTGCGTMSVKNLGNLSQGQTLYSIEFKFKAYISDALQGEMLCRH